MVQKHEKQKRVAQAVQRITGSKDSKLLEYTVALWPQDARDTILGLLDEEHNARELARSCQERLTALTASIAETHAAVGRLVNLLGDVMRASGTDRAFALQTWAILSAIQDAEGRGFAWYHNDRSGCANQYDIVMHAEQRRLLVPVYVLEHPQMGLLLTAEGKALLDKCNARISGETGGEEES